MLLLKAFSLKQEYFNKILDENYAERCWNPETAASTKEKIEDLGLGFTLKS